MREKATTGLLGLPFGAALRALATGLAATPRSQLSSSPCPRRRRRPSPPPSRISQSHY